MTPEEEMAALDAESRKCPCPDERCEKCYEREQKRLAIERAQRGLWEAAERVRLGVRDTRTSTWIIDMSRNAYTEGMREVARAGLGRELTDHEETGLVKIAHRAFPLWWDKAAGLVPVGEATVDSSGGGDQNAGHQDKKNGL